MTSGGRGWYLTAGSAQWSPPLASASAAASPVTYGVSQTGGGDGQGGLRGLWWWSVCLALWQWRQHSTQASAELQTVASWVSVCKQTPTLCSSPPGTLAGGGALQMLTWINSTSGYSCKQSDNKWFVESKCHIIGICVWYCIWYVYNSVLIYSIYSLRSYLILKTGHAER